MQEDDPFRLRREMRKAGKAAGFRVADFALLHEARRQQVRGEKRAECRHADAARRQPEELTPRHVEIDFAVDRHGEPWTDGVLAPALSAFLNARGAAPSQCFADARRSLGEGGPPLLALARRSRGAGLHSVAALGPQAPS